MQTKQPAPTVYVRHDKRCRNLPWRVILRTIERGEDGSETATESSRGYAEEQAAREAAAALKDELRAEALHARAAEAQRRADEALALAVAHDHRAMSVRDAIDEFLLYLREKGNKPVSRKTARHRLEAMLSPVVTRPVRWVTHARAQDLYRARHPVAAVATHRAELVAARHLWRWLVETKRAAVNPWADVKPIGRPNKGKPQLRPHEARDLVERALQQARTPKRDLLSEQRAHGALAVLVALYFAPREGEILRLQGRDIDPETGDLFVAWGKTENARRLLKAPAVLRPLLAARAIEVGPQGRLFPHAPGFVRRWTGRLCKLAGVPVVCAHSLRGMHSTFATAAGATAEDVARMLGHGDTRVTDAHYTRPEAKRAATNRRVWQVINGGKTE